MTYEAVHNLDVPPRSPVDDVQDSGWVNTVLTTEGAVGAPRCVLFPDASDFTLSEFQRRATVSTFLDHIPVVVATRSQPQMCGVAASAVVPTGTVVADTQSFGNRAVGELPSETVRSSRRLLPVGPPNGELTVPAGPAGLSPLPACVRTATAINALPEPCNLSGGKLSLHSMVLSSDVTPGTFAASPGTFVASNSTKNGVVTLELR